MKVKKWTSLLAQVTEEVQQTFGPLDSKSMNWKPESSVWSIAQNLDHLIVINQTYFPVFSSLREGTYQPPSIARFGFIASFMGKMILKGVQPEQKRKTKTFPIWEPSQSELLPDMVDRFKEHQTVLAQTMESTMDSEKQGVIIASPANRNIVYRLDTAFDIIVAHEQRHLAQAKAVLNRLTG